jgi:hypothetical protein
MSNVIDLFAAFSTDASKEEEGTLTTLPECGDTKWLVARAGNKSYKRLFSSLYKKNKAALESKGDAAEAKSNEVMAELYAKTILLGWEGEISYKGKLHKYSQEMARTLLAHGDFRSKVETVANDFTSFKSVQDEEDVGN